MNDAPTLEERIDAKIDKTITNALTVSDRAGGLAFANAGQAMEMAKMMAISGVAIPKHLRGNPGACLAIVIQAIEWRLSPFAVANKSYSVNDRMAYESQLLQAVILQRAPIIGRFKVQYTGEGENRSCYIWATLRDTKETVDYTSPPIGKIQVRNSPLWKSDPDQQLYYYSGRALCRRHFPDVILGVYSREEIEERDPEDARDVTPARQSLGDKLDQMVENNKPQSEPEIIAPKKKQRASAPKVEEAGAANAPPAGASEAPQHLDAGAPAPNPPPAAHVEASQAADEGAEAPRVAPGASAAQKAMTEAHKTGLRKAHADMMTAMSMKRLGLAFDAFVKDFELQEGDPAYAAGEAVLLAHTQRIGGDGSPAACDAALSKVIAS